MNPKFKELEDKYGKIINYYKSGIVQYLKKDIATKEETLQWCSLWNNVINNAFENFVEDKDFEMNDEYDKVHGKIFFKIIIPGDRVTDVNMDMEVKDVSFHPDGDNIRFEYIGEKL